MEEQATYETKQEDNVKQEFNNAAIEAFIKLSGIKQAELKEFCRNVMWHFKEDVAQMAHFNKGAEIAKKTRAVLEEEGMDDMLIDAIATGAMLARTNVVGEVYPNSHVIEFPMFLKKHGYDEGVSEMLLNGVVRIVRSSLGPKTPISDFIPKPGQPEYLVSLLYRLEAL